MTAAINLILSITCLILSAAVLSRAKININKDEAEVNIYPDNFTEQNDNK